MNDYPKLKVSSLSWLWPAQLFLNINVLHTCKCCPVFIPQYAVLFLLGLFVLVHRE